MARRRTTAYSGDEPAARRYERRAEEIAPHGYDLVFAAPRIWLALLRGEVDALGPLIDLVDLSTARHFNALPSIAARLDALAATQKRSQLEQEVTALLRPQTYLEPFALRALGVVRKDAALIDKAATTFVAMGLGWFARQTQELGARSRA